MNYHTIPKTDLKVSSSCLGGGMFSVREQLKPTFALLDFFTDKGGNFIDTANAYGKWNGKNENESELAIGQWLKARKKRDDVVIGTKGCYLNYTTWDNIQLKRADMTASLEDSLVSLCTDYIDLYWIHADDETVSIEEILSYMGDFVKQGKIRYFGCSNMRIERIKEAAEYAKQHGLQSFIANEVHYSLGYKNKEDIAYHVETNLTAIPYSSQAKGLFEKLDKGTATPNTPYYSEENVQLYKRVKKISKETGLSITQIVLGYIVSQPFLTIPIIGSHTEQQLADSMSAAETKLSKDILAYLDSE